MHKQQTVCTRPSPPPILEGVDMRLAIYPALYTSSPVLIHYSHTHPTQTHHTHMPHSLTFSDYHTHHSVVQCETLQLRRLAPVYPVSHECPQYSMLLLAWYSLSPGTVQTSHGVRSQAYCQSWWWGGLVWGEWTPRGGLGVCAGLQAMQYTQ